MLAHLRSLVVASLFLAAGWGCTYDRIYCAPDCDIAGPVASCSSACGGMCDSGCGSCDAGCGTPSCEGCVSECGGDCGGSCDFCSGPRPSYGLLSHLRYMATCGGGCGEFYVHPWINDAPTDCDPCDNHGNWIGPQWCCPPKGLFPGLRDLWSQQRLYANYGTVCGCDPMMPDACCGEPGCVGGMPGEYEVFDSVHGGVPAVMPPTVQGESAHRSEGGSPASADDANGGPGETGDGDATSPPMELPAPSASPRRDDTRELRSVPTRLGSGWKRRG